MVKTPVPESEKKSKKAKPADGVQKTVRKKVPPPQMGKLRPGIPDPPEKKKRDTYVAVFTGNTTGTVYAKRADVPEEVLKRLDRESLTDINSIFFSPSGACKTPWKKVETKFSFTKLSPMMFYIAKTTVT